MEDQKFWKLFDIMILIINLGMSIDFAIVISSCWLRELYFEKVLRTLVTSSLIDAKFMTCYESFDHGTWLQNSMTRLLLVAGKDH